MNLPFSFFFFQKILTSYHSNLSDGEKGGGGENEFRPQTLHLFLLLSFYFLLTCKSFFFLFLIVAVERSKQLHKTRWSREIFFWFPTSIVFFKKGNCWVVFGGGYPPCKKKVFRCWLFVFFLSFFSLYFYRFFVLQLYTSFPWNKRTNK